MIDNMKNENLPPYILTIVGVHARATILRIDHV